MINFSFVDIKYYFYKNQKIFLFFIISVFVGLIFAIIFSISSDKYLSLITQRGNVLFDYINGEISLFSEISNLFFNNFVLEILIFILTLNFWTGLFSFIEIAYQSSILFLTVTAIVSNFNFGGVVISILLLIPINLFYLLLNIIFGQICFDRCCISYKNKNFSLGFDKQFFFILICLIVINFVFSFLINVLLFLLLKSEIFVLF